MFYQVLMLFKFLKFLHSLKMANEKHIELRLAIRGFHYIVNTGDQTLRKN